MLNMARIVPESAIFFDFGISPASIPAPAKSLKVSIRNDKIDCSCIPRDIKNDPMYRCETITRYGETEILFFIINFTRNLIKYKPKVAFAQPVEPFVVIILS